MGELLHYNTYSFQEPGGGWPVDVELYEDQDTLDLVVRAGTDTVAQYLDAYGLPPAEDTPALREAAAQAASLVHRLAGRRFGDEASVRDFLVHNCGVRRYEL
jgi:hypothetical protein